MFEYKFVACPARFEGAEASAEPVRQAVEAHAGEGWRLVQVLTLNPAAVPRARQVVFERPRPAGPDVAPAVRR